jgi:hypothetical protein
VKHDLTVRWCRLTIAVTAAAALSAWAWGQTAEDPDSPRPFDLPACRPGAKLPSAPLALSSDGKWVAVVSEGNVVLRNVADGNSIRTLSGPTKDEKSQLVMCAFSRDGKWAAGTYSDHLLRLWNVETGKSLELARGSGGFRAPVFSPDGSQVAAFEEGDKRAMWIWPVIGGTPRTCAMKDKEDCRYIVFAGGGRTVATTTGGSLVLWDAKALTATAKAPCSEDELACIPPGDVLLTFGTRSYNGSSRMVWRKTSDGSIFRETSSQGDSISHVAVSPTGDYVATVGNTKDALVWETASGNLILRLPHESNVTWAEFGPGGKTLLTYSDTLHSWDLAVLADVKKRAALAAYFDGEADNYARYIRGYLLDREEMKPIPHAGPRAGHAFTTITDRTGTVVELADLSIANNSVKNAIAMKVGATQMSVQASKLKSLEFLNAVKDGIQVKATLKDGGESNGVIALAEATGQGAYGPVQCALTDLAKMTFDFASAEEKPEETPASEDAPVRAEIIDVEGTKLPVTDVQLQGGHVLPLSLGRLRVSLGFKFLRKIEVLRVQSAGVIVKATLVGDRALVGFVPAGRGDQLSGKAGLGDFSLGLKKAKAIMFR